VTRPDAYLGELFMDGRFVVETGSIFDFLDMILRETVGHRHTGLIRLFEQGRLYKSRLVSRIGRHRARANAHHHYDLDLRLFDLFLDSDRQYSCAYFEAFDASLEDAQLAKKRHIAAKLCLEPGQSVLDIGCGWGGLALYLRNIAGAGSVHGATVSEEQLAVARRRAAREQTDPFVRFDLQDYRDIDGRFDRIVSVAMFEAVGYANFRRFFDVCARCLDDNGVMLLHTIGNTDEPSATSPWLLKYIFPGGYIPALSEIVPVIEQAGLMLADIEVWRWHYARTLRLWRERFLARRAEAVALFDERFCRMWEFYLAMCEVAFYYQNYGVFQLQIVKRQDAVPFTRDYLASAKQALRRREVSAGKAGGLDNFGQVGAGDYESHASPTTLRNQAARQQ